jgi:hypothetical protein
MVLVSQATSGVSTASIGFSSTYEGSSALFTLSTGKVEIKTITVIHSSNSKGQIFSLTGNG